MKSAHCLRERWSTGYESEKKIVTTSPSVAVVIPPHSLTACSARGALPVRIASRNAGARSGEAAALEAKERTSSNATTTGHRLTRNSMPEPPKNALRIAQETFSVPLSVLCASERNV